MVIAQRYGRPEDELFARFINAKQNNDIDNLIQIRREASQSEGEFSSLVEDIDEILER